MAWVTVDPYLIIHNRGMYITQLMSFNNNSECVTLNPGTFQALSDIPTPESLFEYW